MNHNYLDIGVESVMIVRISVVSVLSLLVLLWSQLLLQLFLLQSIDPNR